jgi:hypothetical protein
VKAKLPGKVNDIIKEWFLEYNKSLLDKTTGKAIFNINPTSDNTDVDKEQPLLIAFDKTRIAKDTGAVNAITRDNFTQFPEDMKQIVNILQKDPELKTGGIGMTIASEIDGKDNAGKLVKFPIEYTVKRFAVANEYPLYLYTSRKINGVQDNEATMVDKNFLQNLIAKINEKFKGSLSLKGYKYVGSTNDSTGQFKWIKLNPSWSLNK